MTIEEEINICDPVKVAVRLFQGTEDNRRLWGWYCRELGRERFRELLYQKHSENKVDGALRNPAAAFQVLLKRSLIRRKGGVPNAVAQAPHPQPAAPAMTTDALIGSVAKAFSSRDPERMAEERERERDRAEAQRRREYEAYFKACNLG